MRVPAVTESKRQKELHHIINMMKELKRAKSSIVMAAWSADHAALTELSGHLRKITKDINTIFQYLNTVYKKEKILYSDVHKLYESLEIVVGENNE